MSEPAPTFPWCKRHRSSKHPDALSKRLRKDVLWYRRERAKWIAHLGGKCAVCGTTEELEFDHDVPRDWEPSKTSRWQRLRNYIREIKEGQIKQLLCRAHNAAKGYPRGQGELPLPNASEEAPF